MFSLIVTAYTHHLHGEDYYLKVGMGSLSLVRFLVFLLMSVNVQHYICDKGVSVTPVVRVS